MADEESDTLIMSLNVIEASCHSSTNGHVFFPLGVNGGTHVCGHVHDVTSDGRANLRTAISFSASTVISNYRLATPYSTFICLLP